MWPDFVFWSDPNADTQTRADSIPHVFIFWICQQFFAPPPGSATADSGRRKGGIRRDAFSAAFAAARSKPGVEPLAYANGAHEESRPQKVQPHCSRDKQCSQHCSQARVRSDEPLGHHTIHTAGAGGDFIHGEPCHSQDNANLRQALKDAQARAQLAEDTVEELKAQVAYCSPTDKARRLNCAVVLRMLHTKLHAAWCTWSEYSHLQGMSRVGARW